MALGAANKLMDKNQFQEKCMHVQVMDIQTKP